MNTRKRVLTTAIALIVVGITTVSLSIFRYGYMPNTDKTAASTRAMSTNEAAFDLWGRTVSKLEASSLHNQNSQTLSPHNGAVPINDATLGMGREAFYKETFGNEVFLTDIMGITSGAFTLPNVMKALIQLHGQGTTNLRVELAQTVTLGGKTYPKGSKIDTGIDVAKGSYVPIGMPITIAHGRPLVGISCAACHAAVDRTSGKVIEGAPNTDLNAGLLLALATNSTAYFTHAKTKNFEQFLDASGSTVPTSDNTKALLPNRHKLEQAVDEIFAKWPRGNFDSTIDMESNPAQIPDSFTLGDHPYGWSGFAAAGPFKGLSSFSNNVHAQNSDSLSQANASKPLFGMDPEVYLGTILQNAANPKYRYNPQSGQKPSDFFRSVDPTPKTPGVNTLVKPPNYPKISLVAPDGLVVSSPNHKFMEQVNAMAAWQNTLVPPRPSLMMNTASAAKGQAVFVKAGCISCHAGASLTNNRIIPVQVIGTEPSRALALKKTGAIFGDSSVYSFDTPVPIPKGAHVLKIPTRHLDPEQIKLAYAHGNSLGGYKVPSLVGLYWTAPYLHDGGVAVGRDPRTQLGMPGTIMQGTQPDPVNSLRGMVDRSLRQQVIASNKASLDMRMLHVQGIGHEFFVDSGSGFTQEEQDALIHYLLTYGTHPAHQK